MFLRAFSLSILFEFTISTPSIFIDPRFGFNKPIRHFSKTDFPEPDLPIITRDSFFDRCKFMLFKIILFPNETDKFLTSIKFFVFMIIK